MNINERAREDFNKAITKQNLSKILFALTPEKQTLLSLQDVKNLLKPKMETYRGMKAVDIDRIVGSEGRYNDFNSRFFPKYKHIRSRWENIDKAHISDIILPPVKLYQISGIYFVRDGNHRVSVAKANGQYSIDAEVIELNSEIPITPDMTRSDLKAGVIQYEKDRVFNNTELGEVINPDDLNFTATGRFIEILRHIQGHKYFLNEKIEKEIPFIEAGLSWHNEIYSPIVEIILKNKILNRFPGRTKSDLYMWIIKHWDNFKKKYGNDYPLEKAAIDFSEKFGTNLLQQIKTIIKRIFKN